MEGPKDSDPVSPTHSSTAPFNQKNTKVSAGSNPVSAHRKSKSKLSVPQANSSLLGAKEPFQFVQIVSKDQTQYTLTEDDKKAFEEYHKSTHSKQKFLYFPMVERMTSKNFFPEKASWQQEIVINF